MSGDGRYIVFETEATNLYDGDTNGGWDSFMFDMVTEELTLISKNAAGVPGNRSSGNPHISASGRYVTFYSSATNLVEGDTTGGSDIYLKDLQTGTLIIVSRNNMSEQGNLYSREPCVSADGRYVAFNSMATNLVPNDTNAVWDVFVRHTFLGKTTRVSASSSGAQGNGGTGYPSEIYVLPYWVTMTPDGRNVIFYSEATNMVSGDTNGKVDAFLRAPIKAGFSQVSL